MSAIYPMPKEYHINWDGQFNFNGDVKVFFEKKNDNVLRLLNSFTKITEVNKENANILYLVKVGLNEEGYEIHCNEEGVKVYASTDNGFYLATSSLKQIFADPMWFCDVEDEPDFKIRGFMYDISRNKVPTVSTVKYIIDQMEKLKMNHLELYVEGFSFGYKSFQEFLSEDGYLTIEEYQELEKYANDRFIDFVPNMNGFGHMTAWLATDKFKHLGEVEEPFYKWGTYRLPSTLNALDPESLELVKKMYGDMIPFMKSKYFNMNFDEPYEVGKGKTKEAVEKDGEAKVYLDYAIKCHDVITGYGKTPIIWGDVLINHEEALPLIPKDMIFAEWGYEGEHPWKQNLTKLAKAGINFIAAPGTASWCTLASRTDDAFENISNATFYAKELGGMGILLTDWGDHGHLQPFSISIPALSYSGLLSWRCKEGTRKLVRACVDSLMFEDDTHTIANLLIDLGNYYHYENDYVGNATHLFHVITWSRESLNQPEDKQLEYYFDHLKDKVLTLDHYDMLINFLYGKYDELLRSHVDELVLSEVEYVINFLYVLASVLVGINPDNPVKFRRRKIKEVIKSCDVLSAELDFVWHARNKESQYKDSAKNITSIKEMCTKYLGGLK